jgi:hypothetical protein
MLWVGQGGAVPQRRGTPPAPFKGVHPLHPVLTNPSVPNSKSSRSPKKLCLVSVARYTNQAKFFNQATFAWQTTSGSFGMGITIPGILPVWAGGTPTPQKYG